MDESPLKKGDSSSELSLGGSGGKAADSDLSSGSEEQLSGWSFLRKSGEEEGASGKDAVHLFVRKTFTSPTYCSHCQQFIYGLVLQGYACLVCGFACHKGCLEYASSSCKPSLLPPLLRPRNGSAEGGKQGQEQEPEWLSHHWLNGNLPFNSKCKVCQKDFPHGSFEAASCTRCQVNVHKNCQKQIGECKPKFFKLLHTGHPAATPLIVFINFKSGGQAGEMIYSECLRLLDRSQVCNLSEGGPLKKLKEFESVPNLKALVCGGDGTVGWVLSVMDQIQMKPFPSIAILPLGTGNDLSQIMGWGRKFTSVEVLDSMFSRIQTADTVKMDRWIAMSLVPEEGPFKKPLMINNYASFGIDAAVVLKFHHARQSNPNIFSSRMVNKMFYAKYGLEKCFDGLEGFHKNFELLIDGKKIEILPIYAGVIISNIPSYAGGADIWGSAPSDGFQTPSISDMKLEVVAVQGSFHMGEITIGISKAIRIGQGKEIDIVLKNSMAMQIDGEPHMQTPTTIQIRHWNQANFLKGS